MQHQSSSRTRLEPFRLPARDMGVGTGMAKLLLAALLLAATTCIGAHAKFSRHSFPKDFVFGTGSAAYQVMMMLADLLHIFAPSSFILAVFLCAKPTVQPWTLSEQKLVPCSMRVPTTNYVLVTLNRPVSLTERNSCVMYCR